MVRLRMTASLGLAFLLMGCGGPPRSAPCPDVSTPSAGDANGERSASFDAEAAYDAFETALRAHYAYVERDDFDVDAVLERAQAAAADAPDASALRGVLYRAALAFTDPHLLVLPLADGDPNVWPTSGDLALRLEGDDYVVEDVRAGSPADEAGVRPGWFLAAVGDRPIEALVAELLALVPSPTPHQRAYAATLAVNGNRDGTTRELRFEVDGEARALTLANPRTLARELEDAPPLETRVEGSACVIRFANSLGRLETIDAFDEAIETCLERDAVVIDLRNTPSGGNTDVARAIIGHFVSEPTPYQVHEVPSIERRTTVPRRFVEYAFPRAPHFGGRVAVLGGRWTGSMGEGTVIGLDAAAGAHTFASDMGDLRGALHSVELPELDGSLEMGVEALFHVDGTPRADYVADVVLPAADRTAAGEDPALAAALEWLASRPGS